MREYAMLRITEVGYEVVDSTGLVLDKWLLSKELYYIYEKANIFKNIQDKGWEVKFPDPRHDNWYVVSREVVE